MATSADRDEHDEKDKAAEDEESAEEQEKDDKAAAAVFGVERRSEGGAKGRAASAGDKEAEKDDEEEDDEDEEAEVAPKPAPKPAAKKVATKGRGPGAARAAARGSRPGKGIAPSNSLGKSVLLFFVIVIGLGVGFAILGREQTQEAARPKWKVGDTPEVEITVVRSDRQDLACASTDEVAGRHCAFEAANKPWSKGDSSDDKKLLKPYTTTDRIQFTAAGLWSDPSLTPDKLPATRFSVKCKYKVEGSLKTVAVRWEQTGQFFPMTDWYAGSVSDCKIAP